MSGRSSAACTGAVRFPSASPSHATSRPSPMGSVTRGPRSKTAQRLGAPLAFLDESGVLRMPTRRRTWAPAGHTPLISYHYQHDRLSTLAALTVSPKRQHLGLYLRFQPKRF